MQTILANLPDETGKSDCRVDVAVAKAVERQPSRQNGRQTTPSDPEKMMNVAFAETEAHGHGLDHDNIFDAIIHSPVYREYERAFAETTGLPVSFRSIESWQLPHHGRKNENALCALMASKSRSCAACLQVQQQLSETARHEAQTVICPIGLCDSAVPVKLGEKLIGFLQTGQVFRRKPNSLQFKKAGKLVAGWGVEVGRDELKAAYFGTRVVPTKQYEAMVKLLAIFADHIAMVSNQIAVRQQNSESPVITRAKQFIRDHQTEELSLGQVAKAVNTSTFYFCKMFKKVTGLNFTDYVSCVRIEKAKNLLLNPNLRVSEIAFEIGFQSLTHFNRVFKKVIGESPTEYRSRLVS